MITSDTPLHAIIVRRPERIAWDDMTLCYLGPGFNSTTFKARVLSGTRDPEAVGGTSNAYSRDEWVMTGEIAAPESTGQTAAATTSTASAEGIASPQPATPPPDGQFELLL